MLTTHGAESPTSFDPPNFLHRRPLLLEHTVIPPAPDTMKTPTASRVATLLALCLYWVGPVVQAQTNSTSVMKTQTNSTSAVKEEGFSVAAENPDYSCSKTKPCKSGCCGNLYVLKIKSCILQWLQTNRFVTNHQ